jgi:DNA-directed RNA polymerase specialized sigma24 family protein
MPNFLEIYELHKNLVFNLCLQYLQNKQDAEEAAQDVFVKIHKKLPNQSNLFGTT